MKYGIALVYTFNDAVVDAKNKSEATEMAIDIIKEDLKINTFPEDGITYNLYGEKKKALCFEDLIEEIYEDVEEEMLDTEEEM